MFDLCLTGVHLGCSVSGLTPAGSECPGFVLAVHLGDQAGVFC